MNFKKSRNLMWIGFAVGILIMALGLGHENEKVIGGFMIVGAVVFFAAVILLRVLPYKFDVSGIVYDIAFYKI